MSQRSSETPNLPQILSAETLLPAMPPSELPVVASTHDALMPVITLVPAKSRRFRWNAILSLTSFAVAGLTAASPFIYSWLNPPSVSIHHKEETVEATRSTLHTCLVKQGTIQCGKMTEVRNPFPTLGTKIVTMVPYGSPVTAGQEIITLDDSPLQTAITDQKEKIRLAVQKQKDSEDSLELAKSKQESDLSAAQLQYDLAKMDLDRYLNEEKQVELNERKGAIALAERDLRDAEEKLDYFRTFHKRGFITSEQLKAKEAEVTRSRFNLAQSQARMKIFETYQMPKQEATFKASADEMKRALTRTRKSNLQLVHKAQMENEASKLNIVQEEAKLKQLLSQLEWVKIKAPSAGILLASHTSDPSSPLNMGSALSASQVIGVITDPDQITISVTLKSDELQDVSASKPIRIAPDGNIGNPIEGRWLNPALSPPAFADSSRTVQLAISSQKYPLHLKPGGKVTVEFPSVEITDAVQVPTPAVTTKDGKHIAYVLHAGKIEEREVQLGSTDGKRLEIKDGIEVGEQVVVNARKFRLEVGDMASSKTAP